MQASGCKGFLQTTSAPWLLTSIVRLISKSRFSGSNNRTSTLLRIRGSVLWNSNEIAKGHLPRQIVFRGMLGQAVQHPKHTASFAGFNTGIALRNKVRVTLALESTCRLARVILSSLVIPFFVVPGPLIMSLAKLAQPVSRLI